jgi:predicted enzyme related to lactoylglutathione lyase
MGRVVHFEIPADHPDKLQEFYTSIFGWSFQKMADMDYWLAETGQKDQMGINGAITRRQANLTTVVNTISIKNIDETMKSIKNSGGQVLTPVMDIPNVGKFAYCKDPDNNIFGILEVTGTM